MKTLVRCSLLALAAACLVPAQTTSAAIKAKVPFEFTVMGRTMPAGDYVVDRSNSSATVILKCQEHKVSVIVPTDAAERLATQQDAKLIFHRYGDQYFLSEIWGAGTDGRKLHKTKLERDLALRDSPNRTVIEARR